MSRVLVILAAIALVGCILSGIHRCRRRPDLAAHYYDDEYDRFAIANAHCVESLDPYRCRGVL